MPKSSRSPHSTPRHRSTKPKKTKKTIEAFLAAVMDGFTTTEACEMVGIDRKTPYNWRTDDPEGFGKAWALADQIGCDPLEKEAKRRAIEGWIEDGVRKYDGRLLTFLMSAKNPARFRQNVNVTGTVEIIDRAKALKEARARVEGNGKP